MEKLKREANAIRLKCLVACSTCHKPRILTLKERLLLRGKTRFSCTLAEQMPEAREGEANFESAQGSHRTPSASAVSEAGGLELGGPLEPWHLLVENALDSLTAQRSFPVVTLGKSNSFRSQFSYLWNGFLNAFPIHSTGLVVKLKSAVQI